MIITGLFSSKDLPEEASDDFRTCCNKSSKLSRNEKHMRALIVNYNSLLNSRTTLFVKFPF